MRDQGAVGLRQEGRDAGAARPRLGSLPPRVTGSGGVRAHARAASRPWAVQPLHGAEGLFSQARRLTPGGIRPWRSEEHTSELQSPVHLVCRLLLEKKKKKKKHRERT